MSHIHVACGEVDFEKILATDWAYLAGIYDGEGSVCTHQRTVISRTGPKNHLAIRFVVTNSSYDMLESLCMQFGGSIHTHRSTKTQSKPHYQWLVSGKWHIRELLRRMLPYLRYKAEEARLTIEFYKDAKIIETNRSQLTVTEQARRIAIIDKIRSIPGRRKPRTAMKVAGPIDYRKVSA